MFGVSLAFLCLSKGWQLAHQQMNGSTPRTKEKSSERFVRFLFEDDLL